MNFPRIKSIIDDKEEFKKMLIKNYDAHLMKNDE
jgi:hypothetical protein